jgi:2-polyprenyl-6-methoxyphenol hydroxylase-like FAD-dependent oxidoreductase
LSADLEMHLGPGRYVGLCKVPGGRVNVCGLFYFPKPDASLHQNWPELFRDAVNSRALDNAEWDENSFCAVAGLTMDVSAPRDEFSIGDAAAMIPPLTGNGMSMAVESASLALPHLLSFSSGKSSWNENLRVYTASWRRSFGARLAWAGLLQKLIFRASGQRFLYFLARAFPAMPNLFFARTR